jgi:hypothetical protein
VNESVIFIAGVVAPIGTCEKKLARFLQVVRPRCEGCEIHLAASNQFVAGITAPPEMSDSRIQFLRHILGDLCARAGFVIHFGESPVPATTAMDRHVVVSSMTIDLAGKFLQVRSHLTALEPQGVWEGDEVRPRLRTHLGAVVTYHSSTQRLQFQGRHAAAIDLRDRFLARIGRG